MYKTVWTPQALAFVAFWLNCGGLSSVNALPLSVASDTLRLRAAYLLHVPNKRVRQTMCLTVKYTLNEVRLTIGVYGMCGKMTETTDNH